MNGCTVGKGCRGCRQLRGWGAGLRSGRWLWWRAAMCSKSVDKNSLKILKAPPGMDRGDQRR